VYIYLYDEQGSPIGFQYRSSTYEVGAVDTYWYEKNLQGDVVAVYNSSGTKLVSYTYTAWGEFTMQEHNGGFSTPAVNNPLLYRGYYYDTDLQLYYLISRYYDAKLGRFISPDSYLSTGQGILGHNMYAYCNNNPVNRVDYGGDRSNFVEILLSGELTWPGEIHRAVQKHIAGLGNPNDWEIEHHLPGGFRVDLVYKGKYAYEIKPFTYNNPLKRVAAIAQLQGYIQLSGGTLQTGQPNIYTNGTFEHGSYIVTYYYMGDGLIFYNATRKKEDDVKVYSPSPVPATRKDNNEVLEVIGVLGGAFAIGYGLGMAGGAKKSMQICFGTK